MRYWHKFLFFIPQNIQSGDNCKKVAKSEEGNLCANQQRWDKSLHDLMN